MSRITCVHLLASREPGPECVEYDARFCLRAQNGTGECERLPCGGEGDKLILRVATKMPFVSDHFCYRISVNDEEGLNNVVRVNGCLGVKCNMEETTYSNILHAALKHSGFKGAGKKVAKCLDSKPSDDDEFMASFFKHYESNDEKKILVPKLRLALSDAIGCFTRHTRIVGANLYCMGFTNLESMSRELRVNNVAEESWFLSLGDVDKSWTEHGSAIDTVHESFASFQRSFRGLTAPLVDNIEKHIQLDPKRFFSTNTRPMALRALGDLDKDYYVLYCSRMTPPLILNPDDLVSVDPDSCADEFFVDKTPHDKVFATCLMAPGVTVQRCAVAAMTSLVLSQKKNRLQVVSERQLQAEVKNSDRNLVDWRANDGGDGGSICEVHIFCATNKISLVFDKSPGSRSEHGVFAAQAFVSGSKPHCHAHVYLRDAHLLTCNVFSHLMWRLSRRVGFKGVTLSHRCSDDRSYHSIFWVFVQRLFNKTSHAVSPEQPLVQALDGDLLEALEGSGASSITRLAESELRHLTGVCVVPTAKEARYQAFLT